MKNLKCTVLDQDKFTKELIVSFIKKTNGISLINSAETHKADVVFIDAALFDGDYLTGLKQNAKVVIISSNQKYIHSFFQNEIADYFSKSEIKYDRFMTSIEKVRTSNS